ncbi:hypothetical protein FJV41_24575 [Myxococcus llanfairpwllgwyngyllgogerychwyrndrobwllllantysiliogogogochensis]|uniref:Uncharacterized protein n=1 Tax=Myxococcus llanfairpwllgwyngyllgogerychwyrndrobwllllantysiliogogogochensis TaxID=2590453 RepID=A0A540WW98_9BACT|nr:hypothetical protein [Myxococcus llanfairpwllgwyngyllgogerychwyrndrobwllllantysiliogogogochensis]TQF13292.1 hypothetical protein FJV41_24575 [Myxococcus llanfairpwllgwyngyllgogerychwyrndrobwllllantysiliogogogochensis]
MKSFFKQGMMVVVGAVVGLGAVGVGRALIPTPALGPAGRGHVHDDYARYTLGPEGYVAQSDLIVTGRVTRQVDTHRKVQGSKRPRYFQKLELEVDAELYRNAERLPGSATRVVVAVPAAGMDASAGRAHLGALDGHRQLFFLRRSPDVAGAFVLLRGDHGHVDLDAASVQHEVLPGATPSALLDTLKRFVASTQLSVPRTERTSLDSVPQGAVPGRLYGRADRPATLTSPAPDEGGTVVFDALPEGAVATRVHVVNVGERCFVRLAWEPGPASGPVALHIKDGAQPSDCAALLDKTF